MAAAKIGAVKESALTSPRRDSELACPAIQEAPLELDEFREDADGASSTADLSPPLDGGGWSLTDLGDNTRLLSERLLRTTKKKKNLFLWPIFRP